MRSNRPCNLFSRLRVALAVFGLAAAACLLLSCGMPELTRVSEQDFPRPESCSHCHVEIYAEWKQSPHARAFVNERFRRATDDYAFQDCLGCHAPKPTLVRGEPAARTTDRKIGVACATCHLDQGAMVGPLPPTGMAKPHPIRVDAAPFANGALCGHCHQGTLSQWQASRIDNRQDCRHCHMPAVHRTMTQATSAISRIFVAAEKAGTEHRHTFALVPTELIPNAFALDVKPAGTQATISLTNRLPHNLPTGDFGVRIVEIVAEGLDAQQVVKPLGRWELTNFGEAALPSGQSRQWTVTLSPEHKAMRVRIARHGRDGADRVVLLQKEVPLP